MKLQKHSSQIFSIDDFWTAAQCDEYIARSEGIGYEAAKVMTDQGEKVLKEARNNQRVLYNDVALAQQIWADLQAFVPAQLGHSKAVGLNELFRFYKYEPGQLFKKHRDQSFIRNEVEASYFTFLIYLNDDFEGGNTTFNALHLKKALRLFFGTTSNMKAPSCAGA